MSSLRYSRLTTNQKQKKIATELYSAASKPIHYANESLIVGCSIGVALYPDDDTSLEKLISKADKAMYRSKNSHKRHCFFNES